MRDAILALAVLPLLASCSMLGPSRSFLPLGDFETSTPRSSSEGGHTATVVPPRDVSWNLAIDAYRADRASNFSRYEMYLDFVDRGTPPGTWRIEPLFDTAELVDDEGGRFPCTRAAIPDLPIDREVDPAEVPARQYALFFDVPGSYRFERISGVVVHWSFVLGGRTVRVTTRFRSA